jgi:hypothetical protein
MYNKNRDKACTDLKLRWKRRWKFYAINQENQCRGLIGEFRVVKPFFAYC